MVALISWVWRSSLDAVRRFERGFVTVWFKPVPHSMNHKKQQARPVSLILFVRLFNE